MERVDLIRIRKGLLYGGINEIAHRAGVSSATVTAVFSGKKHNITVLNAIAEVAKEHKAKREQAIVALNEVLQG